MATRLPQTLRPLALRLCGIRAMSGGQLGDGAGRMFNNRDFSKGGGGGGSVREAGGAFGKMEAAKEEQYFRQLQKEQFNKMKEMLEDEVAHHERQIRQHQEAIEHHKQKMHRIKKKQDGTGSESE